MKYLLIFTIFLSSASFAQNSQTVYDKVIGIMKTDFNYDYEAEVNTIKTIDLTKPATQQSTKMAPLVFLEGKAVKMNSLKDYTTDKVKEINTYLPGSKEAGIYGNNGDKRGVINISLNE